MEPLKFFGTATIGSKGQFVIPAEAREAIGLGEGTKLIIMSAPMGDGIVAIKSERFEAMMQNMTTVADLAKQVKEG